MSYSFFQIKVFLSKKKNIFISETTHGLYFSILKIEKTSHNSLLKFFGEVYTFLSDKN